MSLLDTFPIGDPEVLVSFLKPQYPGAPFVGNDDMTLVFAKNVTSCFNASQKVLPSSTDVRSSGSTIQTRKNRSVRFT
jgi:hypothetical protein